MNNTPLVNQLSKSQGPEYVQKTIAEFSQRSRVPVTYTWNTPEWSAEGRIKRLAKFIFSIIVFPIAIYHFLHYCLGKIILPASSPMLLSHVRNLDTLNQTRKDAVKKIFNNTVIKCKRVTIGVDGYEIDAAIAGSQSNLEKGRWVLLSCSHTEFYEEFLDDLACNGLGNFLSKLNANVLMYNYPGVGESSGRPNHQASLKAYRAMLHFLEDDKEGIGAKTIVGFGHFIGGGFQGEALVDHTFHESTRYVFIKNKTFSTLSKVAELIVAKPAGFLIRFFGWDINAAAASKTMPVPEIIIQGATVPPYTIIKNRDDITDDDVIPPQATLAAVLLPDLATMKDKLFLGTNSGHKTNFEEPKQLAERVNERLSNPR